MREGRGEQFLKKRDTKGVSTAEEIRGTLTEGVRMSDRKGTLLHVIVNMIKSVLFTLLCLNPDDGKARISLEEIKNKGNSLQVNNPPPLLKIIYSGVKKSSADTPLETICSHMLNISYIL